MKVDPAAGLAVSITTVLGGKLAVQIVPQLMPAGVLIMVPEPVPVEVRVSAKGIKVKVAPTVCD